MEKNKPKNQTYNLFWGKKSYKRNAYYWFCTWYCVNRAWLKISSRKLTMMINRGKAGIADRWCHRWLRSRVSYVLLVGFFSECFIERRQMLRSCTVGGGWVIEHGALVEWYWKGETEVMRGKGTCIVAPIRNPIWILLGSKLVIRGDRWTTKDCCFECHFMI
jgi:hypothetical protein